MLHTLEAEGLVEILENDGRYWLTRKVKQLSDGFDEEEWISAIARPEMTELTEAIAWPAMLMTPVGIEMVLRATTDPQTSLLFKRYNVGHAVPMLGSASGRCYLAFSSQARLDAIVELISRTAPGPWADLAQKKPALQKMLKSIRRRSACIAATPNSVSMSLAVPILVRGQPRATLGMRYFKSAMSEAEAFRRFLDPLRRSAERISRRWLAESET
jgi:IclR family mhp operon transcriptional activator